MTINKLIDEARRRGGYRSDAQLSRALGWTDSMIGQVRSGTFIPNVRQLKRIAAIAGAADHVVELVVIEKLEARARDPETRQVFAGIKRRFFIRRQSGAAAGGRKHKH